MTTGSSKPKDVLQEILAERGATYGDFTLNAAVAQTLKCQMKLSGNFQGRDTAQEALDVIASKLSRLLTGNPVHEDTWRDIAGYATLVADRIKDGRVVPF